MNEFLTELGLSEGIIESIKWWLPYVGFLFVMIFFAVVIKIFLKRRNNKSK